MEQSVLEKRTLAFRPFAVMTFSGNLIKILIVILIENLIKAFIENQIKLFNLRDAARERGGKEEKKANQYQKFLRKYQGFQS